MRDTRDLLIKSTTDFPHIQRSKLTSLQVNLGYLCNLSCTHCHVNAGPKRTELMDKETCDLILQVLEKNMIKTLDLTGGAPEMNPHFKDLVASARSMGVRVIDRCNLTILNEPGYEDLVDFLTEHKVEVCASLPCYSEDNVDSQRGKGVYASSIEGLQKLNARGFGVGNPDLKLDLVYNPGGAFLPPPQESLEADYKKSLMNEHGIQFDQLLTITNMPISRFGSMLISKGEFDPYMQLLRDNFSADNLKSVMCRGLVSVDWQGNLYDCDFNQMLLLPLDQSSFGDDSSGVAPSKHLRDLLSVNLEKNNIAIGDHCYGCTAGQGSSCGGALA